MKIPPTIVTTHDSEWAFSPAYASCNRRIRRMHPTWEHRFFSEDARRGFIKERRPDLLELYEFYPRAVQKSHLFRVVALYELGGFYLNLDIYLFENLDVLCASELVLTEEREFLDAETDAVQIRQNRRLQRTQIGEYAFGAMSGHWFLECLIEEMIRRAEAVNPSSINNSDVFFTTGAGLFTSVYLRHIAELVTGFTLLRGRSNPPHPAAVNNEEDWCFQFGRFGNYLKAPAWNSPV